MAGFVRQFTMGFCWWDLVAALLLVMTVMTVVHRKNQLDDRIRELEDQIAKQYADDFLQDII